MRVYDCFMFFNELDLLEIRLNTLTPHVHKFVLVESPYTFSGKEKPLYYEENKNDPRFASFKDKITHIIHDDPVGDVWETSILRQRESNQRSSLILGLKDIKPDDIIIVSDADEIWNSDILSIQIDRPYRLKHKLFYYYFNCKANELFASAFICLGNDILENKGLISDKVSPTQTINKQDLPAFPSENTGWHFSWLGNPNNLAKKMESFCHEEYDTDYFKDTTRIQECIDNSCDLFGREHMNYEVVPYTLSNFDVPQYIRNNTDRFGHYIKTAEPFRASLRTLMGKKDLVGAEIGVHFGCNAVNMLRHLDIKKLYLIDPYCSYIGWGRMNTENEYREETAKESLSEYSDKLVWIKALSSEAVNEIEGELDFVYIDGNHAYDFIKEDIRLYYPKLKIDGLLCGHDYSDPPVKRAVDEAFGWRLGSAPNSDGAAPDWWAYRQKDPVITAQIPAIEQDVVMGVFTHRTTYLPGLLDSIQKFLPHIQMIVKVADNPINENMELLRQDFLGTNKRFWIFLDDDIEFLDGEIVYRAAIDLLNNKFGAIGVYSTFDPDYELGSDALICQEVGWIPGYFIMVDSHRVGHIQPDLNLPHKNTAIDTTYSICIRIAGYHLGVSPSVVYHKYKYVKWNQEAEQITNDYLLKTWGDFYFKHAVPIPNVIGRRPNV